MTTASASRVGSLATLTAALVMSAIAPAASQQMDGAHPANDRAASGVTALTGLVLDAAGRGLPGISVSDDTSTVKTDTNGRYLLEGIRHGVSVLRIDGTKSGSAHDLDLGYYEIPVFARSARTTSVSFTSWLTPIDHTHDVTFASPTAAVVRVTNPAVPNVELRIDPGVTILNAEGDRVTSVGITAIPTSRPPFPLGMGSKLPMFFTIQPSSACLYTATGLEGHARILLPNYNNDAPHARRVLYRYSPDRHGWEPYGFGTVTQDGLQIMPDQDATISNFGSSECASRKRSIPTVTDGKGATLP